jgi:adenylate cyclase
MKPFFRWWLKGLHGRTVWLLPPVVVALCLAVALWEPVGLQVLRHTLFDQYQRWQPRPTVDAPVRVIDIDDESLRRLGQWPWPRTRIAELADRLQSARPAVVAFDMLFAEPDRTAPAAMVELWAVSGATRQAMLALPDHDAVLTHALSGGPFVLGLALERLRQPGKAAELKAHLVARGEAPQPYLHAFSGAINPLPALAGAASGVGAMTFIPDADGVVRRVPLLVRVGDAAVPSLAAEAVRVAQGTQNYVTTALAQDQLGLAEVRIGQIAVPVTPSGEVWLHYARPGSTRTIAAWKVLAGDVAANEFAGNIVLVGTSAQGLMDLRFTPLGQAVPGVEIHAQLLTQLLTGGGLIYPAWASAVQLLAAAVAGLAVGYVALLTGAMLSFGFFSATLMSLAGLVWYGFSRQGLLLDGVVPALTVLLSYVLSSLAHHFTSDQRRRWVKQAFSRYVSPNLVAYLIKQPAALELSGKRQECSFIFTDLANSTTLLEAMDAAAAVTLINDYLDGMIAIVFAHQGTLTRIVGDGLAIMFSAPVAQVDHRQRALTCAWELHQFASHYAATQQSRGTLLGLTRVGVHSGEVIVGNFGGSAIFDYRALGDPINTAARLEGANKHFGTTICVSQATLNGCAGWPARPIGQVLLKGKTQTLQVLEPLAPQAVEDAAYQCAFALLQARQPEALSAFQALSQQRPDDALVAMQLARLRAGETGDCLVLNDK